MNYAVLAAVASILIIAAAPAYSADVAFTAALSGDTERTNTGSKATGNAMITVDTDKQTIDVALKVTGISFADFFDQVVNSPVGPIHLHHYAADGEASLLIPFPMGPSYAETADGFTLTLTDYRYAEGARILKSNVSFDGFLAAMKSGAVVLNIHTDKFQAGEISGRVKAVE